MTRYLSASLVLSIGPTCQFPLSTTFEHLNMTSALHYAQVWRLVFLSSATLCSDQAKSRSVAYLILPAYKNLSFESQLFVSAR